jgi:hypothetical protein
MVVVAGLAVGSSVPVVRANAPATVLACGVVGRSSIVALTFCRIPQLLLLPARLFGRAHIIVQMVLVA